MAATKRRTRWFLIYAGGAVEEVVDDYRVSSSALWSPGLFEELVLAGYPMTRDEVAQFDGIIDLSTDGERVTVYTNGTAPHEHDMGEAAGLFLGWYHRTVTDERGKP